MKTENPNTPIFGTPEEARVAPKFEMPKTSMPGEVASVTRAKYRFVAIGDRNIWLNVPYFRELGKME